MKKLPKDIYNQLSDEGKAILINKLKKSSANYKTKKVRQNMANDIARKVVSAINKKSKSKRYKRKY